MNERGPGPAFDPPTSIVLTTLLQRCTFGVPTATVHCAVSGGPDSLALLALAVASGCDVHAHHVDHGLRPGSASEAEVVASAAARFGAGFTAHRACVEAGPNLEARARQARYETLPNGVLTGHTADDQAETVLLALLRGSAWQGLGGMSPSEQRPLLGLRRAETHSVCDLLHLHPVQDPSNHDPAHRRNRVRHELMPLLDDIAQRDLVPVLARQAELFRQGGAFVSQAAASLDPTDAKALAAAPELLARQAVRTWIWAGTAHDHPPPLATVDRVLMVARLEARGTDVGAGWRVERSTQRLRLVPPARTD